MNSNNRIAEILRDIVCLRNISINILHKGDNDDDDNNVIIVIIIIIIKIKRCSTSPMATQGLKFRTKLLWVYKYTIR